DPVAAQGLVVALARGQRADPLREQDALTVRRPQAPERGVDAGWDVNARAEHVELRERHELASEVEIAVLESGARIDRPRRNADEDDPRMQDPDETLGHGAREPWVRGRETAVEPRTARAGCRHDGRRNARHHRRVTDVQHARVGLTLGEGKLRERCLRIRDRDVGRKEPRTKEGELNPPKNSETGRDRDRDGARVPSDRQPRCGSGDLRALRDDWTYLSVARCPSAHLLHGKVALYGLREKDFAAAELRPR